MLNNRASRHTAVVIAAPISLVLASCGYESAEAPRQSPSPAVARDASSAAVSRDEMLREAMAVVAQYDSIVDQVTSDYSVDASLLSPYATEERIDELRAFQDRIEASDRRLVGETWYSNEQVQEFDPESGDLAILVCADSSQVRVIDGAGADVTPADRPDSYTLRISFVRVDSSLKVREDIAWDGATVC